MRILTPVKRTFTLKFISGPRAGEVWGPSETQTQLLIWAHSEGIDPEHYVLEEDEPEPLF